MHNLDSSGSFHKKRSHVFVSARIQPNLLHSCTKLISVGTFDGPYLVDWSR